MPENNNTSPLLVETAGRYPALLGTLSQIGFRQSPPDPNRGLEYYPKGEEYSFDPSRPSIEVFGNSVQPKDVAGDISSHYPESDPKVASFFREFEQSLTPGQKRIIQEQYQYAVQHEGEKRPFEQWYQMSGLPAYFRGYAFQQWPANEIKYLYTPAQLAMFDRLNSYLRQPPAPPKPPAVQMHPVSVFTGR